MKSLLRYVYVVNSTIHCTSYKKALKYIDYHYPYDYRIKDDYRWTFLDHENNEIAYISKEILY